MARRRQRTILRPGELNLTAMVDVAFQLLAFSLLAFQPPVPEAQLATHLPSPPRPSSMDSTIRLSLLGDGIYACFGKPVSAAEMDKTLNRFGEIDPEMQVRIACALHSSHGALIALLDACARHKMTNITVVSGE